MILMLISSVGACNLFPIQNANDILSSTLYWRLILEFDRIRFGYTGRLFANSIRSLYIQGPKKYSQQPSFGNLIAIHDALFIIAATTINGWWCLFAIKNRALGDIRDSTDYHKRRRTSTDWFKERQSSWNKRWYRCDSRLSVWPRILGSRCSMNNDGGWSRVLKLQKLPELFLLADINERSIPSIKRRVFRPGQYNIFLARILEHSYLSIYILIITALQHFCIYDSKASILTKSPHHP